MNLSASVSQPAHKYAYCNHRNAFVLKSRLRAELAFRISLILLLAATAVFLRFIHLSGTSDSSIKDRVSILYEWYELPAEKRVTSFLGVGSSDSEVRELLTQNYQERLLVQPGAFTEVGPLADKDEPVRASELIQRRYSLDKQTADSIANAVFKNARDLDLDPMILLGLIHAESTFQPNEVSSAGAMGLMQIVPSWHVKLILEAKQKFGLSTNLFTPEVNIWVGSRIKKQYLLKQGGNLDKALLQYNGSSNDSNKTYYHKVLSSARFFSKELRHESSKL